MIISINKKLQDARDEEGFTLIELMIVVVIIGILAAIAIPIFSNQQKNAHKAGVKSDVRNTNTALATALTKNPTATGFVTYKTGEAVPALTAGQVAVQTTNTNDNVVAITDIATASSAPDTATGNGAWNGYQILGKSPAVDGYCYYFTSTAGKYSESDDCSAVPSSDSSTSTPTATATSTPFVSTSYYSTEFTFTGTGSFPEWTIRNNAGAYVTPNFSSTHAGRTGTQNGMFQGTYSSLTTKLAVPKTLDPGTYTLTFWGQVDTIGNNNWTVTSSTDSTNTATVAGGSSATWAQISYTFKVTTASQGILTITNNRGSGAYYYIDSVNLQRIS